MPVLREEITKTLAFFSFWFVLIAICTILVALDGQDFESTITAVYTCIGNVGPGLEYAVQQAALRRFPHSPGWSCPLPCLQGVWKFIRS